jgi:hypothetical protein
MREAGFQPFVAAQSVSRIEGKKFFTKHVIRFRPTNMTLAQVGDTTVEAILVNSHDGTSCYELSLGAMRLACLNGMMVSEGLQEAVRIRHTGSIIQSVVLATQAMIENAPKVVEAIKNWKAITLKPEEALILAEEAHSLRFADSPVATQIAPASLLQLRRGADNGTDLWSTFNRVQENVMEGGLRTFRTRQNTEEGVVIPARRSRTQPIKGIAENIKLNRALWSLAEKMAALKTA